MVSMPCIAFDTSCGVQQYREISDALACLRVPQNFQPGTTSAPPSLSKHRLDSNCRKGVKRNGGTSPSTPCATGLSRNRAQSETLLQAPEQCLVHQRGAVPAPERSPAEVFGSTDVSGSSFFRIWTPRMAFLPFSCWCPLKPQKTMDTPKKDTPKDPNAGWEEIKLTLVPRNVALPWFSWVVLPKRASFVSEGH